MATARAAGVAVALWSCAWAQSVWPVSRGDMAFAGLTQLELVTPLAAELVSHIQVSHIQVSHILTTQRFTHLQQLSLPVRDPELAQQLQDWRHTYGIGEVAPEA